MIRKFKLLIIIILTLFLYFEVAISSSGPLYKDSRKNLLEATQYKRRVTNELSSLPQLENLDHKIEYFMEKWQVAGATVGIMKDGKLVYAKGFGYADREKKELVQPEHLFRVASISKLITAVAIMRLVEDGSLSLDDQVFGKDGILNDSIYLDIRDKKVEKITVRHLLEHSAGWSSRGGDPMFNTLDIASRLNLNAPVSIKDIIRHELKYKRIYYTPGSRSLYSNFGFVVLGEVIRKISGVPYEFFVKQEILLPLGIEDMAIGHNLLEDKSPAEVHYYDKYAAPWRLSCYGSGQMVPRTYGGTDIESLSSAGGWIASSIDLLRFLSAIDNFPEREDILSSESIATITTPREIHLSPLGWRDVNDQDEWWRTGTLAGSSAILTRRPDNISFVMITNSSNWRGSYFSHDMKYMLSDAIEQITDWPDHDLFEYQFPHQVSPIPPAWWITKNESQNIIVNRN
ncbi:MAG: serine hydrolase domain-containing protein [Cyclobacteriaceae bacterium]